MTKSKFGTIRVLATGFQVRYTHDGQQITDGTYPTRLEAENRIQDLMVDIRRGDWWDDRKGKTAFSVFAPEALSLWADLAPRTVKNYETLLRTMLLPTFGQKAVGNVTVMDIDRWWARHSDHPVNRRNAYFVLKKIFNQAQRAGMVKSNPCIIENAGKDVALHRPTWSEEHYEAVLAHIPGELRTAVVMAFTGHLRIGELVGMNASDYETATGVIHITKQHHGEDTKTGTHKHIRLLDEGIEEMSAYLKAHPRIGSVPLFEGPRRARLPVATIRKAWDEACADAGYANFHFHDIRHISLTLLSQAGVPDKDIQYRAGHSAPSSTQRYLHNSAQQDAEMAKLASARRFRKGA